MTWDWVWLKQVLLVGAVGLAWPWLFRGAMAWVIAREGESLPGPRLATILLSLGLAVAWPLFGEAVFAGLSMAGLGAAARPAALALMGLALGAAASFMPYTDARLCLFGGVLFGVIGGLAYGFLAWPFSALAALTLVAAGPMLGLTSPTRAKWKAMRGGRAIYGWRGRLG